MSYILDALKKSEQQRLAGDLPGLHSGHAAVFEAAAPQRKGWLLALVLLAVNLVAIGGWFATRPSSPARAVAVPELPAIPAAQQPTAAPTPQPAAWVAPQPAPANPVAAAPATAPQPPSSAPPRPKPAMTAPPAAAPGPAPARPSAAAPRPAEPESAPPAPPRGIVAYADLPASVKNALPPLKIGGYIDGAGEAMLVVDDRLVREGEEIGPGVKVVKIAPEASVFSFRGYRFRR